MSESFPSFTPATKMSLPLPPVRVLELLLPVSVSAPDPPMTFSIPAIEVNPDAVPMERSTEMFAAVPA